MTTRDDILNRLQPGAGLEYLQQPETESLSALPGRVLGGYRVGPLLAEGGMSHVFLGARADGEYERTVAIKVIASGGFSPALRERYLLEKDILSRLNHPNIAQLYDAGHTEEGWSYLVMEYVEGKNIDAYCRERQLSPDACVDLVLQTANAVSYAHRHLIVHRDIKPSNVLVTSDGTAKLLDFGIAKLLPAGDGHSTLAGVMSPIYASPEQLLGDPVGVESDVYQLGLLLLVMLGEDVRSLERPVPGLVERLAEDRSIGVSATLKETLDRDLVVILEKSLQTVPSNRYLSVETLISDLRNYRRGFAISARAASPWYLTTRYAARNRTTVGVAAIALCAIVGSSTWYTVELSKSREFAASRAASSDRMLSAITSILNETHTQLIRSGTPVRNPAAGIIASQPLRYVLERTQHILDEELAQEPVARAQLLRLQGTTNAVLREFEQSLAQLTEALALAREAGDTDLELRVLLDVASTLDHRGDLTEALEALNTVFADSAFHGADRSLRARAQVLRGRLAANGGEFAAARDDLQLAIAELEDSPAGPTTLLADAYKIMADTWIVPEFIEEGRPWVLKAITAYQQAGGENYYGLRSAYSALGWTHQARGEYQKALTHFTHAREIALHNFGMTSQNTAAETNNMAMALRGLGRFDEAVENFEQCVDIYQILYDQPNYQLALTYSNMGNANADRGAMLAARENYELGLELTDRFQSKSERVKALLHGNLGRYLVQLGDLDTATDHLQKSLALKESQFEPHSPSIARTRISLAEATLQRGNVTSAELLLAQASQAFEKAYADTPWRLGYLREVQGRLALAQHNVPLAEAFFTEARDLRAVEFITGHPSRLYPLILLASTALTQGDNASAFAWLTDAPVENLRTTHPTRVEWEVLHAHILHAEGKTADSAAAAGRLLPIVSEIYPGRQDWLNVLQRVR